MTSKKWWFVGIAVFAVVAVAGFAGFAVWYFVFRDTAPAKVSLQSAGKTLEQTTSSSTPGTSAGAGGLDGTWTVDPSIGSFTDFTGSFAGFRVQEQLVGIGAKTSVGRTPKVTGGLTVQGTTIPTASFDVDMTTLRSDESQRDDQLRSQAIETARFPKATFVLTSPIALGTVPADGGSVKVDATGDLTLHGVTKRVTIPLEAQRKGTTIAVVGSVPIVFADYSIRPPTSFKVLSVDDHGTMEVQLFLTKSA